MSIDEMADTFLSLEQRTSAAYKQANSLDDQFERCRFSLIGQLYRFGQAYGDAIALKGDRYQLLLQFADGRGATPILKVLPIS